MQDMLDNRKMTIENIIRFYTDHKPLCAVTEARLEPKRRCRTECNCGLDTMLKELGLDIGPGRRK